MEQSPIKDKKLSAPDDEPNGLTASEEENQVGVTGCEIELAAFYEPAVDMNEWV